MRFPSLFLALALLTGCHAKFKKYASTVGTAHIQVMNTGGPFVQLGYVQTSSDNGLAQLAAAVVNTVQAVKGIELSDRVAQAVQVGDVNQALTTGIVENLGSGPPFGTDPNAPALLQLEMLSYGLFVPSLGAAGQFTYDVKIRVYTAAGKQIYKHRETCSTAAGDPEAVAVVLGVVNNVKELNEMSDAQINQAFVDVSRWCGMQIVTKMRKHAG